MKRIFYFLVTNLAIVLVLSITMRLLGVEPFLNANGLNLNSLLIFAAVMGFGGAFISLAISKWSAKQMSGAVTIENPKTPDEIWLMNIVKKQSQAVGIQMPEVAIFNSPEVNAFATGMSRNSSLVAVSSGLLEMMTKDEAEAVIGHEISHIANGDMVTLTLIQGVVNTFVLFFSRVIGYTVDKVVFKTRQGTGPAFFITMIISELLLGVLASIVVMWFSRQREYRADFGGGQLAGKQKMIAALQRLKTQYETSALPKSIAALGISGEQGIGLKELFSTHPSLDDRIARLQQSTN
ncbi:protease HtpX [Candidatus Methylopumilus universalis]|jgi:heat shock protein HtpX|uniref:Protease HtpX homolog n=1 Tax=Candidatus Methylopumilus universalis TaxID=2588536 RepID=A0AAX1F121_9PROT|nr:protease HtpX [Candidatus Methylopumilus universalis]QDC41678.1 protease HtpX [Candidatus Methylopumilus universalis]QDC42959.1 protease HtpX [Candidatus Methylopumilus universalis]QDC55348.1 protease HtpX [Candidatus Methylopumilus universalis]QDC56627.1 protease HtpX [Candidatus Methylopumilus universalis]QDC57918.1 protease HtpX [Candidatus Methylopumilus universalis]